MPKALNLLGLRFERLVVIEELAVRDNAGKIRWLCRCSCGNETIATSGNLKQGLVRSCGCLRIGRTKTHATPENICALRNILSNMIRRCYDCENKDFSHYGGRGIGVCNRWRFGEDNKKSVECFYEDMGERPGLEYSIERVDNNQDYMKDNCIWAKDFVQKRNRRDNRWVTYKGKNIILTDAINEAGLCLNYGTVFSRIQNGWTVEDAVSKPVR